MNFVYLHHNEPNHHRFRALCLSMESAIKNYAGEAEFYIITDQSVKVREHLSNKFRNHFIAVIHCDATGWNDSIITREAHFLNALRYLAPSKPFCLIYDDMFFVELTTFTQLNRDYHGGAVNEWPFKGGDHALLLHNALNYSLKLPGHLGLHFCTHHPIVTSREEIIAAQDWYSDIPFHAETGIKLLKKSCLHPEPNTFSTHFYTQKDCLLDKYLGADPDRARVWSLSNNLILPHTLNFIEHKIKNG